MPIGGSEDFPLGSELVVFPLVAVGGGLRLDALALALVVVELSVAVRVWEQGCSSDWG